MSPCHGHDNCMLEKLRTHLVLRYWSAKFMTLSGRYPPSRTTLRRVMYDCKNIPANCFWNIWANPLFSGFDILGSPNLMKMQHCYTSVQIRPNVKVSLLIPTLKNMRTQKLQIQGDTADITSRHFLKGQNFVPADLIPVVQSVHNVECPLFNFPPSPHFTLLWIGWLANDRYRSLEKIVKASHP